MTLCAHNFFCYLNSLALHENEAHFLFFYDDPKGFAAELEVHAWLGGAGAAGAAAAAGVAVWTQ